MGLDRRADEQLTNMHSPFGFWAGVVTVFGFCMLLLALPPALIQKSWERFFVGFILSPFAVILPLAFFFLSIGMTPEAKDQCHYGALDCFHTGKLALAPFVLWATAALYAVEIVEVPEPSRPWIINGLILGAIISSVCTVFGFLTNFPSMLVLLLVPLYTSIWYVARALHAVRTQSFDSGKLSLSLASSLPFWALSALWTSTTYRGLPEHPNSCFVVTAASRGHRKFVGPFFNVPHRGLIRIANRQLATLWAFEALWHSHAPRSHAAFRRVYNIVGPMIAERITSPWMADVFYLALKPAEWIARFVLNAAALRTVKSEPRHLGSYISCARQS